MPYPPVYGTRYGSPFLMKVPDFPESSEYSLALDNEEFVSDTDTRVLQTMGGKENEERTHTFSFKTRDELEDFLDFLKQTARGRWGHFWMPSWAEDFYVLSGDMFTFTVKWCGYTEYMFPSNTHRHILIVKNRDMSTIWGRYIGGSVDNGDGTETISGTIDFPYDLSYSNLPSPQHRHMYLHMCRLVDDNVQVKYFSRDESQVTIKVVTLPEEAP